ncbi:Lysosomal thiol [Perkinsus chesapeaki]|uniref:Lysosomal thiol n=1 Tax=Perkinsus chesapeaki TaxID=330153 RepID=A0A7J6MFI1_PERCH|nr:Lysosomal thiol [Perkinsus chesapeaki]
MTTDDNKVNNDTLDGTQLIACEPPHLGTQDGQPEHPPGVHPRDSSKEKAPASSQGPKRLVKGPLTEEARRDFAKSGCYSGTYSGNRHAAHHLHDVALVNVDLYYESLCPYCRDFITEDLSHVMNQPDLEKHINLTFVPYGNAKINETTKTITCQHGEDECHFNFYEGCMIAEGGQDQLNTFRSVFAIEGSEKLTDDAAEDACKKFGLNFNAITTCRNSEEAYELQRGFAKTGVSGLLILCLPLVTEEARRDFAEKYVPWIVVNGKHIEREKFAETLCKALNEDPAKCEMAGGRGFLNRPMQEVSEA